MPKINEEPMLSAFENSEAIIVDKADCNGLNPESSSNWLWCDSSITTVACRRHGKYSRKGYLTGQIIKADGGIDGVRQAASQLYQQVGPEAEVRICASPSYMPIRADYNGYQRVIQPSRGRMTAAIYGVVMRECRDAQAGFLEPSYCNNVADKCVSKFKQQSSKEHRVIDRRLGDFFEYADSPKHIRQFMEMLPKVYGSGKNGLNQFFWNDYKQNTMPFELQQLFIAAGGISSIDRTLEVVDWLEDKSSESNGGKKQVVVGISHEETLGSLTHHLANMLADHGSLKDAENVAGIEFGYNEGYDIHFSSNEGLMAIPGGSLVQFSLLSLRNYLQNQKLST